MMLWELPGFHEVLNHEFGVQLVLFLVFFQLMLGSSLVVSDGVFLAGVDWDKFGVVFNATVIVGGRVYSGMMVPVDVFGQMNITVGCNRVRYGMQVFIFNSDGSKGYPLAISEGSCLCVRRILVNGSPVNYVVLGRTEPIDFHDTGMPISPPLRKASPPSESTGLTGEGRKESGGGEWSLPQLVTLVVFVVLSAVVSSLLTYIVVRKC